MKRHNRLSIARAALVMVVLVAATSPVVAGGGPETGTVERPLVALGLKGPTGVALLPLLQGEPIDTRSGSVSFSLVGAPDIMVARLVSGEADIGMLPSNVAAQLFARGVPLQIGAATLWGVLYVVSEDASITSWSDLAGRRIHSLAQGSTPDILLRHLLAQNGVDPDRDVEIDYRYGHVELAQVAAAGDVEIAVLPEPFVTQVTTRNPDASVVLDFQTEYERLYGESYPQTVVLVRSDRAAENAVLFREALNLVEDSLNFVAENPGEVVQLPGMVELGLPAPVILSASPRINARFVGADDAAPALFRYFEILHRFEPRSVGGSIPGDEIIFR